MTVRGRQRSNGPIADWIVCRGAQRDVHDGGVECPVTGEATAFEACLDCHYLAWAAGERDRPSMCALDELS